MKKITFDKAQRAAMVENIQRYFVDELDSEIGALPAEQFIAFLSENIGAFYYNQGLRDAQALFAGTADHFNDGIYGLEQREARAR